MLQEFARHLRSYLTEEDISLLLKSLEKKRYQGLLLNEKKMSQQKILNIYPSLVPHPIIKNGFIYDPDLISPGKSYLFNAGIYYIQDLSAMLVAYLLENGEDEIVVDLCAAPGGKTVQYALNNPNSLIIANDLSGVRAKTLAQNTERFGLDHVIITNHEAGDLLSKSNFNFDKIILDAPCSGSGMFRKSEEMSADWSINKVLKYQEIQKDLIVRAYQSLAPGGTLIYSTCSFSYEEDEAVVLHLLATSDAVVVPIKNDPTFYMSKDVPGAIHLFPHLYEGDGHFICRLQRPGKKQPRQLKRAKLTRFGQYELPLDITQHGQHYFGLKYSVKTPFNTLRHGVFLGDVVKGITSYNHHLALYLSPSFANPLNQEEKEKYLRGETFINHQLKDGYSIVKFDNVNLGFVKTSQHQAKNHYPKGLRFR